MMTTNQSNEAAVAAAAAVFSAPAPQGTVHSATSDVTRSCVVVVVAAPAEVSNEVARRRSSKSSSSFLESPASKQQRPMKQKQKQPPLLPPPPPPPPLPRPPSQERRKSETSRTSTRSTSTMLAEKSRLAISQQPAEPPKQHLAPKNRQQMEYKNNHETTTSFNNNNNSTTNGGASDGGSILADKRRFSERSMTKQQSNVEPPILATFESTITAATTATTTTSSILADKRRVSEQKRNSLQQHVSTSTSTTSSSSSSMVNGSRHRATSEATVVPGEAPLRTERSTTTTTHPGAIHIHGWSARDDDDSELESSEIEASSSSFSNLAESTTTLTTTSSSQMIVSAQLVDEDELQRHAELLFQQMISQAAVAELVDEDEMRQRAHDQAALEFQKQLQQRLKDQETAATQQDIATNKNNKRQQQRRLLRNITGVFCIVVAVIAIVVVAAVFSGLGGGRISRRQQQQQQQQTLNRIPTISSITPTSAIPSFSPSAAPSPMPSAASSWRQIGNNMNGIQELERFGAMLGFSADGNTVVANTETPKSGQVRAYTYHNETDEWKQLGSSVTRDFEALYPDTICLSPNGKYLGFIAHPVTGGSLLRIFALRDNTTTNATTTEDGTAWEQIGPDIVHSSNQVAGASLTDNLVLASGHYYSAADPGSDLEFLVHIYQFDANQSDWVRMGQDIQIYGRSLQLAINKSTGTLILAVGGRLTASTFRYDPDTDSWIQFGSELTGDDETNSHIGVWLSLSMDGETITMGVQNDAVGQGIGLLKTFSYDASTDDWLQLGKDLKDSSFLFAPSFSLSADGKVLVTTTQKLDSILAGLTWVTGQVRTWDYIADSGGGVGGEWIQRGAALEVGTANSDFGYRIALSAAGNRLATSAIHALNEQGVRSGKIRVFEQY